MLAVLGGMIVPATSQAHHRNTCHTRSCIERVYRKHCWRGDIRACIHRAGLHWHVAYRLLDTIVDCESGHQPNQVTPPDSASGLMQFLPSTWAGNRYARHSVFSPKWNSLGGAWLIHVGGLGPWAASRHCWGPRLGI